MRYALLRSRAKSIAGVTLAAALVSSLAAAAPAAASARPASPASARPSASACLAQPLSRSAANCTGDFARVPVSQARSKSATASSASANSAAAAFPAPPAGELSPAILSQAYGLGGATLNSTTLVSSQGERMTVALVEAGLP